MKAEMKKGWVMLLEDVVYHDVKHGTIIVRAGFSSDGATIPRFAWSFVGSPLQGSNRRAGIIHDMLYRYNVLPRIECDKIFYRILRKDGKRWVTAKLMYWAVRLFSKEHYAFSESSK